MSGGFPEIRDLPLRGRHRLYRDYVDSVVDKDVADLFPIRKPDSLRRLIDQVAARTAAEINMTELGKSLGIRLETVEHYMDILVRLSMVTKLGAWTSGEAKREVKNAKYHFVDSGISSALRRLTEKTFRSKRFSTPVMTSTSECGTSTECAWSPSAVNQRSLVSIRRRNE